MKARWLVLLSSIALAAAVGCATGGTGDSSGQGGSGEIQEGGSGEGGSGGGREGGSGSGGSSGGSSSSSSGSGSSGGTGSSSGVNDASSGDDSSSSSSGSGSGSSGSGSGSGSSSGSSSSGSGSSSGGTVGAVCPNTLQYGAEAVLAAAGKNPIFCPLSASMCPANDCCYQQASPLSICVAK